jgi:hypothetical protein
MSKIFTISNTQFNTSKILTTKEWLKNMSNYFSDEFIPYLRHNSSDNDILIHLGNLTSNSKNINLEVLKFIQDTFETIGTILPIYILVGENDKLSINILKNIKNVEIISEPKEIEILVSQTFTMLPYNTKVEDIDKFSSDYCFFNFDINTKHKDDIIRKLAAGFKKCYCGFYDKNGVIGNIKFLGAPYNLEKDNKKGFIELETHTNKDKFILNKNSPSFKEIKIDDDDDLNIDKSILSNNYIKLTINKKLFTDNKLKIDMLLAENEFVNISYTDDEISKDRDLIQLDGESVSLIDMINEYIEKSTSTNKEKLIKEFEKITKLND